MPFPHLFYVFSFILSTINSDLENPDHTLELPQGFFDYWYKSNPKTYDRTYYVDNKITRASDDNPGTKDLPFLSIQKAADILKPGERVIIREGTYFGQITPQRGGSSPTKMITYEAADNEKVVITGAIEIKVSPKKSKNWNGRKNDHVWLIELQNVVEKGNNFLETPNISYNRLNNLKGNISKKFTPNNIRELFKSRSQIFVNGQLLQPSTSYFDMSSKEKEGYYWYDSFNNELFINMSIDENEKATIMISLVDQLFAPQTLGLGYIRLNGLDFKYAANQFPWPQAGMVSTSMGHHWLIENCSFSWANSTGLDIGALHWNRKNLNNIGHHIIRRNTFKNNGLNGIVGIRSYENIIEHNYFENNSLHDIENMYESGAIKTHRNKSSIIRNNLIINTKYGPGIWMDLKNKNSRCTGNIVINTNSIFGAIFFEASKSKNWLDNNVIINSSSNGIYQHDCDSTMIFSNIIVDTKGYAIKIHKIKNRVVDGVPTTSNGNIVNYNFATNTADSISLTGINQVNSNLFDAISKYPYEYDSLKRELKFSFPTSQKTPNTSLNIKPLYLFKNHENLRLNFQKMWSEKQNH